MKALGRLALAAALLVPVGIATANSAGASGGTATCSQSANGAMSATPGFKFSVPQKQSYNLATHSHCTGGVVTSADLTLKTGEPIAVNCNTVVGKASNSGSSFGVITWSTGFGHSNFHGYITITGTTGHTTTATLKGTINTSPANTLFAGEHVTGTLTLNKGLHTTNNGGDCTQTSNLKNFTVTASTLSVHS